MKLHNLAKITRRPKKIIGRGIGSGKGKTAGRGTKGQKSRGSIPVGFIGGTLPIYKKLPYRRGLGNPKRSAKAIAINLKRLFVFKPNQEINSQALVEAGFISPKDARLGGVKIVGSGEIKVQLTVSVPVSAQAAKIIEQAGGKIIRG